MVLIKGYVLISSQMDGQIAYITDCCRIINDSSKSKETEQIAVLQTQEDT